MSDFTFKELLTAIIRFNDANVFTIGFDADSDDLYIAKYNDENGTTEIISTNMSGGIANETAILNGTLSGEYVNDDVESMRNYALSDCTQLTSVSMASLETIGNNAFLNDTGLESVNMPELTTIGQSAFKGCSSLTGITLPKLNIVNNNAFENCVNLASANLPEVTKINNSGLRKCKLNTIVLPKLTNLDTYALADNGSLTGIDLPKAATLGGGSGFINDSSLTKLILRNSSMATLVNVNYFNGTPFASGGTGGTIYVPSALISSYTNDTKWGEIIGYANNNVTAIEGSAYETKYVDGTDIV